MLRDFLTLRSPAEAELIEKRSRFIAYARPVESETEAAEILAAIRVEHRDATHHVYAYQIGRQNELQRSNDDGEPSGTAGRPVLDAIRQAGLQNSMVVVVRYFGGTLLGTGGLVRAYGQAAALGIAAAGIVKKVPALRLAFSCPYPLWGKLESGLAAHACQPEQLQFREVVELNCLLPVAEKAAFFRWLQELSGGSISPLVLEEDVFLSREPE